MLTSTCKRWRLTAVLLSALTLPAGLWAQNSRGSITGRVTDSSGAIVPNATVTATEENTGAISKTASLNNGEYLIADLAPGKYSVSVEARGFKRLTISGLNLDIDTTLTQDLTLELGQTTESVTVSGTTNMVDTTSGAVGTTVNLTNVLELPLNDRYPFELMNLTPGAVFKAYDDNPYNIRIAQFFVAGSRTQETLGLLDGVDNTRGDMMGPQTIELEPPPDFLSEMRVETVNLGAEWGRTSGGVVNVVTKGGTNGLHGDAYEFVRNDKFDAAGWGTTSKPELRRNIPGVTLGGPIRKNKTFFFGGYEHLWNNTGSLLVNNVGLPQWYTGNFSNATRDANGSAVLIPIYDPATKGTQVFPGNIIPASRINPAAAMFLQKVPIPAPNQTPLDPYNNTGNFQSNVVSPYTRSFYMGRVDHDLSDNTKIFFRYMAVKDLDVLASQDPAWGIGQGGQPNPSFTQNMVLNLSHLFSPTFFMNVTVGFERLALITGAFGGANTTNDQTNWQQLLGLANVPGPGLPQFNYGGGTLPLTTPSGNARGVLRGEWGVYSINKGQFTKVSGNHTLKFGVEYDRFNNNDAVPNGRQGTYTFAGSYTQGVSATGAPIANTGIGLADFLLGDYTGVTVSQTPMFGRRAQEYGGYIQDDWRVTPNLTVNLGLRYDTSPPVTSPTNAFYNFNPYVPNPGAGQNGIPAGAIGETTFENRNGVGQYLWQWDKNTASPRFGFAYKPFGRTDTVVRGGYGIFFSNPFAEGTYLTGYTLGFSQNYSASYAPITNPSPPLNAGVPPGSLAYPPASALTPTFGDIGTPFATSAISFYDPRRALPYSQNFNLTIQHQWREILFEAGVLGNLSRHTPSTNQNINLVPPQLLSQTSIPIQLRRPFTEFTGPNATVTEVEPTIGISNYWAMTLKAQRSFKNGFSFVAHFTWSKWIDDTNFASNSQVNLGDNNGPQNIYNLRAERSLADNNIPFRLILSPVWDLPFGKGRQWMDVGGIRNAVLGGWETSMVGTFQSGAPFGPTVLNGGTNILQDPSQTLRPNIIPGCNLFQNQWQPAVGERGIQFFNPACFTTPAPFTYGNQSRTLPNIRGPGTVQYNVSFSKNFQIEERFRLQLRMDALDLFNTPLFALPGESLGGSNFGIITAGDQALTRRTLEFGIKLYW